ncbi:MAG: tRNA preQ1(34) S-adenosylmethionine ribosyltransferase-isomerase QueA [Deltaproteobacteria bacterium]|nr:tRNA preQ1(34) S-adenosylmethionine ribosyltransferase-isomerase QueA [Deltaproteobacteria bacterium]
MHLRLSDFDYHLPPELIARHPVSPRHTSRLLVLDRRRGGRQEALFSDLPDFLDDRDFLVVNDTRVFPARLRARKETGGQVELLLHHLPELRDGGAAGRVRAGYRARRPLRPGQVLQVGEDLEAKVTALPGPGVAELELTGRSGDVRAAVEARGETPLPPYLRRAAQAQDRQGYQTIFAARPGAVACPTAGLHFTPEVLAALARRGVETAALTLHVGPGTFLPVRREDFTRHTLLAEYFELSAETARRLNAARAAGKRLVAVGTTAVRVLEHTAGPDGFTPQAGECGLYIYPGYRFRAVDRLLTNFHLPRSTLLLLVAAFAGRELILAAYQSAIAARFRFYSYGDCMLIL